MITFLIAYFDHFVFLGPTYIWQGAKSPVITVAKAEALLEFKGTNREVLCNQLDGHLSQYYTLVTCMAPIRGQFVQVLLQDITVLALGEVEVHGF